MTQIGADNELYPNDDETDELDEILSLQQQDKEVLMEGDSFNESNQVLDSWTSVDDIVQV